MLRIDDLNLDHKLSIGISLYFSSDVLPLFEAKFPDDLRPREAIESAIKRLHNPCEETRTASRTAGYAASKAADAASSAAYAASDAYAAAYATYAAAYAGYAAGYAGYAAANAANAAANAANAADNAAVYAADNAAVYAAYAAGYAAGYAAADKGRYIHDRIVKIMPLILKYKIENEQPFNNAEKVLEYLNDDDKGSFLFNLDVLR